MPRAKGGTKTRARHKKRLKLAKGYYGAKSKLFRTATEAVDRAQQYAYRDRRNRKRDFRRLWITRITAACRNNGMLYSRFINALRRRESSWTAKSCPTWPSMIRAASQSSSIRPRPNW